MEETHLVVSEGVRVQGCSLPGGPRLGRLLWGGVWWGIKACWSFKAGQLHNLQKSKPCNLWSISWPQIESDPFIFQVPCEKEKNFCACLGCSLWVWREGTVAYNLTFSFLLFEHEGFWYLIFVWINRPVLDPPLEYRFPGHHLSSKEGLRFPFCKGGYFFSMAQPSFKAAVKFKHGRIANVWPYSSVHIPGVPVWLSLVSSPNIKPLHTPGNGEATAQICLYSLPSV